jgi:hypothetical protein
MSNPKDDCMNGNRRWKWFRLMKEYKSIEVMNKKKMHSPQEPKLESPVETSNPKDSHMN